ncbi:MAG: integrase [Ruminococcaceae bacterium]|nr:integrase [Oscillospiraceae bacterium]
MKILFDQIKEYKTHLINEEKCRATIEKYVRDIEAFYEWLSGRELTKELALEYKAELVENYAPASVNSILASLNGFFAYNEWHEIKLKNLKIQRRIFCQKEKELTKAEYERLLKAAKDKKNERIYLVMQTICATGIRVSELSYITAEAVRCGQAQVKLKGKIRMIILNKDLCRVLKRYMQEQGITTGCVFVTRNGKPLDRHGIWKSMKDLCESAGVSREKVFPHNLRHLFAKTYYSLQKDIVRLADILGHSSINTTRLYTIEAV